MIVPLKVVRFDCAIFAVGTSAPVFDIGIDKFREVKLTLIDNYIVIEKEGYPDVVVPSARVTGMVSLYDLNWADGDHMRPVEEQAQLTKARAAVKKEEETVLAQASEVIDEAKKYVDSSLTLKKKRVSKK